MKRELRELAVMSKSERELAAMKSFTVMFFRGEKKGQMFTVKAVNEKEAVQKVEKTYIRCW